MKDEFQQRLEACGFTQADIKDLAERKILTGDTVQVPILQPDKNRADIRDIRMIVAIEGQPIRSVHYANYRLNLKSLWEAGKAGFKVSALTSFGDIFLTLAGAIASPALKTFSDVESAVVDCINRASSLPRETERVYRDIEDCLEDKGIPLLHDRFQETLDTLDRFRIFQILDGKLHLDQKLIRVRSFKLT